MDCQNFALYGMVKFTKRWLDVIYVNIKGCGMSPSDYDPYLFMGDHVIYVIHIDDFL